MMGSCIFWVGKRGLGKGRRGVGQRWIRRSGWVGRFFSLWFCICAFIWCVLGIVFICTYSETIKQNPTIQIFSRYLILYIYKQQSNQTAKNHGTASGSNAFHTNGIPCDKPSASNARPLNCALTASIAE